MLIDAYCVDNIDDARLEAELLYGYAAGIERVTVIANGLDNPKNKDSEQFELLLDRRLNHEPLAYILGHKEFYNIDENFIPDVFLRKKFGGKNDKNTISLIRSSLLKIYGFFSGF